MNSCNSDLLANNDFLSSNDQDRMMSVLEKLLEPEKSKKDSNQNCFSKYFCCFSKKNKVSR